MDGLDIYGSEYLRIRFQPAFLDKIAKLENAGRSLAMPGLSRVTYVEKHALLVGRFMLGIQNLLATTSEEKSDFIPWTSQLSNKDFAILLWEFYQVPTDYDKIQILAECLDDWHEHKRHFSSAALRSITALARMLESERWGVASWRTLGCLGYESMTELKSKRLKSSVADMKREFAAMSTRDIVDAMLAMRNFIQPGLPTAASVASALYCISLDLWPFEPPFEKHDCLSWSVHEGCNSLSTLSLGTPP